MVKNVSLSTTLSKWSLSMQLLLGRCNLLVLTHFYSILSVLSSINITCKMAVITSVRSPLHFLSCTRLLGLLHGPLQRFLLHTGSLPLSLRSGPLFLDLLFLLSPLFLLLNDLTLLKRNKTLSCVTSLPGVILYFV